MNSAEPYKTYVAGLQEGGDMTVELHIANPSAFATDPVASDNHDLIFKDFTEGKTVEYMVEFPKYEGGANTAQWRFNCIVTSCAVTAPVNEKLLATMTLKVVGKPTYVVAPAIPDPAV
jgi:hypothetical protein